MLDTEKLSRAQFLSCDWMTVQSPSIPRITSGLLSSLQLKAAHRPWMMELTAHNQLLRKSEHTWFALHMRQRDLRRKVCVSPVRMPIQAFAFETRLFL